MNGPRNPLIDPDDSTDSNLSRLHAYAAFLQTEAEHATNDGRMAGENYGRMLAHKGLTNALQWLQAHEEAEFQRRAKGDAA